MKTFSRGFWGVLLLCSIVLVAISCTSSPDEGVLPDDEAAPGKVQYGGTLNWYGYNAGGDPYTWDLDQHDWSTDVYAGLVFEKLFMGDLDRGLGGTGEYTFDQGTWVPEEYRTGALAESAEVVDDNTIIINLREGVKWQNKPPLNGREFVATDVVHSLDRRQAYEGSSPIFLNWYESSSALDDHTVEVKVNHYFPFWQDMLGWGYYSLIWPPELMDVDRTDWRNLVGTGPFMIEDFTSGVSVTYVKNPDYWGTTTIDGEEYQLPFVDEVVWHLIDDPATAVSALRTGKIDIFGEVEWYDSEELVTDPDLVSASHYGGFTQMIVFKTEVEPFNDPRVRQAMSMAIDRPGMIETMFGGDAVILGVPFLPGYGDELYTPVDELPGDAARQFTYDLEAAKQLLADAGYPDGFETELIINAWVADMASAIAANWAELGIQTELTTVEFGKMYDMAAGRAFDQMIWFDITGDAPSTALFSWVPDYYWNPAVGPLEEVTDSGLKAHLEYYLASLDDLNEIKDPAAVNVKVKEMMNAWLGQTTYIILPTPYLTTFWQPWVQNYYGEISTGVDHFGPLLGRIWIDQTVEGAEGE